MRQIAQQIGECPPRRGDALAVQHFLPNVAEVTEKFLLRFCKCGREVQTMTRRATCGK